MADCTSIAEFLTRWDAGDFTRHRHSMCEAGWWDWFCTDRGLYGRLERMVPAVRRIARSDKIHTGTMRVIFKNNCPAWVDETYDDFRIVDGEGEVLYTIVPRYPAVKPEAKRGFGTYARSDIQRVCEVFDFVADPDLLDAINFDNLARGKPIDWKHQVVYGTRKEMYSYFGV